MGSEGKGGGESPSFRVGRQTTTAFGDKCSPDEAPFLFLAFSLLRVPSRPLPAQSPGSHLSGPKHMFIAFGFDMVINVYAVFTILACPTGLEIKG